MTEVGLAGLATTTPETPWRGYLVTVMIRHRVSTRKGIGKSKGKEHSFAGWWFQVSSIFFIFTPILGEMIQFDEYFHMGWFNHEPVFSEKLVKYYEQL